jgi:hypothetical protein
MAEADHSAVWAVANELRDEIQAARAEPDDEKALYLQRRLWIWVLKAIAQERVSNPAALAVESWEPDPGPEGKNPAVPLPR